MGEKEGEEWGNNEREKGNVETTQMVAKIGLEDKNTTEVDWI